MARRAGCPSPCVRITSVPGGVTWTWTALHLYRIGNLCDTCPALFERFASAPLPLAPPALSQCLRDGLVDLSPEIVDTVAAILPDGIYLVALLDILPAQVENIPGGSSRSAGYCWEISPPREASPPTAGWRRRLEWLAGRTRLPTQALIEETLAEAALPLVGHEALDPAAIDSYKQIILAGKKPTALAFSLVDVRYPSGKGFDWRLAHFLLDGHHKLAAAAQLGKPITLLSFLNARQSFAPQEWIDKAVELRYRG